MDRRRVKEALPDRLVDPVRQAERRVRMAWRRRHRVHRAMAAPFHGNLDLLARIYGTDKSRAYHGYSTYYARHLEPFRRTARSVLEIGIGGETSHYGYSSLHGGQSLRMWQDYFPKAQIIGIDIESKQVDGPRIHVRQGSQDDPEFLEDVAREFGPFDVIVDDGSHLGRHVAASLEVLLPHVRSGGMYIVEDLEAAYHPMWEGGPPGTPGTQAELIKTLVDDVLRRHWDTSGQGRPVCGLHLYDEIVFLERSPGPGAESQVAV